MTVNRLENPAADALRALKEKRYEQALESFLETDTALKNDKDLRLLLQITQLLVAVKSEIATVEPDNELLIEEVFSGGQTDYS
ncbi:MAG: hypothetical protein DRP45_01285 [Candidatus Zixiibacteriota bacterium]|nr:MAG: hypothetical protein DRP45_01285 [candidate division Zixibacteria bacterium]